MPSQPLENRRHFKRRDTGKATVCRGPKIFDRPIQITDQRCVARSRKELFLNQKVTQILAREEQSKIVQDDLRVGILIAQQDVSDENTFEQIGMSIGIQS